VKESRAGGKITPEITIIQIPGVLCPSYGVESIHVREKIFPHLTPHLFAQSISVLSWISGWLTSRHFGRGPQVPHLEVMPVALTCSDGTTRR
jgi:hypothetical protein